MKYSWLVKVGKCLYMIQSSKLITKKRVCNAFHGVRLDEIEIVGKDCWLSYDSIEGHIIPVKILSME